MNRFELKEALRAGRTVFGTLITSDSPRWPAFVAACGLDFVFLDTEHSPYDRRGLAWMCVAYAALGLPPLVRIPAPDPYAACVALDGGAAGVIAPYIETCAEVEGLVGAVKRRPVKGAKLAELAAGRPLPDTELGSYVEERNRGNLLILNIESAAAIDNLDRLLAYPEVDALLIGPHDLSCSLGIPERYDHPEFIAAVDAIIAKARAAGRGAGYHKGYVDGRGLAPIKRWMGMGLNMVLHEADMITFREAMRRDLDTLRA